MTATRLVLVLEVLCRGWALPAATSLILGWAWLYTMALPEQVRTARRGEIRSDLHDQIAQDREEGASPSGTALHVLCRMVSGAWDDVGWSLPHIPSTLVGHLVRRQRCYRSRAAVSVGNLVLGGIGSDELGFGHVRPAIPLV